MGVLGPIAAMVGSLANIRDSNDARAQRDAILELRKQEIQSQVDALKLQTRMQTILADPNASSEDIARAIRMLSPNEYLKQAQRLSVGSSEADAYTSFAEREKDPTRKFVYQQAAILSAHNAPDQVIANLFRSSNAFTDAEVETLRKVRTRVLTQQADIIDQLVKAGKIDEAIKAMGAIAPSPVDSTTPDEGWEPVPGSADGD